ncbi:metallophosphoesterase [Planctomycetaceae bacterium SCGC AG-212-F19]|nr:metallophosphoesterase [Planctomycetaceae bacterium SCGC AG-212-F19]
MTARKSTVRLAAAADLHVTRGGAGALQPWLTALATSADVLLLGGDLTGDGHPEEAQVLARELAAVRIPIIAVLGNHDYHADKQEEIRKILTDAGVVVLDGGHHEVLGIGFAGAKGFAGGFDQRLLEPWGETLIKQFVREAVDEAVKLESALARLNSSRRIVLLHYAPIRGTVEGEPVEIFPFLGSSRLEDPINRHGVLAVFHGHAHHGSLEGRTRAGVPVYNVAQALLRQRFPDRPPFYVLPISVDETPPAPAS